METLRSHAFAKSCYQKENEDREGASQECMEEKQRPLAKDASDVFSEQEELFYLFVEQY